eukprot:3292-Heterococcus_DN1.PRE.5
MTQHYTVYIMLAEAPRSVTVSAAAVVLVASSCASAAHKCACDRICSISSSSQLVQQCCISCALCIERHAAPTVIAST